MSKRKSESKASNELATTNFVEGAAVAKKPKKSSRSNYENRPIIKFKRYISGLDAASRQKKIDYSHDPEVIKRRKFCNQQRLARNKILEKLAKNGELMIKNGKELSVLGGCIVLPDEKKHFIVKKNGEMYTKEYSSEIDLMQIIPVDNELDDNDKAFLDLCERFINGDTEIVDLVRSKRTFVKTENPAVDVGALQKKVKKRIEQIDESETDESIEGEPGSKS